ncbi:MAG: HDOD domain-containing protein [Phycisphaerales bacterium]|nr:MAG: HDOD domain-containing protein [Phycisphaerales bacterium]
MFSRRNESETGANNNKRETIARRVAELVDDLPLFPTDVNRLLVAAVKPSTDGREMLRLMESDPGVRDELLPLARSYFGAEADFESVEDAVEHLGVQPLVQLIGISYARDAIRREFAALKYLNDYVGHAEDIYLTCGILGEICSLPAEQRRMYALAGLIHDVGRLAIMVAANQTAGRVLATLWDRMVSVVRDEKADVGTDHCEVGARICRRWNFSPAIEEGVRRHHTPLLDSDFSFAGALIFISHFVSASDPSGEILATLLASRVLAKLNLSAVDFERARAQYKSRITE